MALLEKSQYSQRKLALRALIEQLEDNPEAVGPLVSPELAWQILACAERCDPEVVAEILLYPTVGVWLTRALHYTRPGSFGGPPWAELGYLHLIAAAAAVRSGLPCVVRVPVWHGVVTLPTIGQWRLPISFPVGVAEVRCVEHGARLYACGGRLSIDLHPEAPGTALSHVKRHVSSGRGLVLTTQIEDLDPYRAFGAPQPPGELDQTDLTEWQKILDEAWEVLTRWHRDYARELTAGFRALVPVQRERGIVGASSPSAFGGIVLSASSSAIELAEALAHELQHSKLNALLDLVELTRDDGQQYYAPWRDYPRPLTALLHGIYAFTCGVEIMHVQRDLVRESDGRPIEFAFTYRRNQVRRTLNLLQKTANLTPYGRQLVESTTQRLVVCEQASVCTEIDQLVDMITVDHHACWRLWFLKPDPATVEHLSTAWLDGARATDVQAGRDPIIIVGNSRTLPAQRRDLLRTKALEPDVFARLVGHPAALAGSSAHAAAALCLGDHQASVAGYRNRIRSNPDDLDAWVGLGLALRAQGQIGPADTLLKKPELTVAVYRRVRARGGNAPDPAGFASWIATGS